MIISSTGADRVTWEYVYNPTLDMPLMNMVSNPNVTWQYNESGWTYMYPTSDYDGLPANGDDQELIH